MLTATKNNIVDIDREYLNEDYTNDSYDYDRAYQREARETPYEYKEHLLESLQGRRRALNINEYEDRNRYRNMAREDTKGETHANFQKRTNENGKKSRVFKKKLIPFLACYFLMMAVVVALIVVNVQGTAWESKTITINANAGISAPETANAISTPVKESVALNQVVTSSGVVSVALSPYPTQKAYEEDTNWFDRFCDWVSNLVGG